MARRFFPLHSRNGVGVHFYLFFRRNGGWGVLGGQLGVYKDIQNTVLVQESLNVLVHAVHELKVQVAVLNTQHKHLTERVRVLEDMNKARTGGVTDEKCAEDIVAEEPQRKKGRKQNAEEKRIADRCAKVLKKNSEYPLHQAACDGERNEVLDHFILNLKIHVDIKENDNGSTPLHVAAYKGYTSVIDHLLTRGAAIDAKTDNGMTPLHIAADEGHTAIVDHLLNRGAAIDAKNKGGWTPLHIAAQEGHTAIGEHLLTRGAAIDAKTDNGTTPLWMAENQGHNEVAALLRSKGGTL